MTLRLAMWSGPRNISTAMMRAWENRPDTRVVDEPFYACYLAASGLEHPMRDAVIASQSTEWAEVAAALTTAPVDAEILYQKHMTHHMLEGVDLDWTRHLVHCFLIRDPVQVVRSYVEKRHSVTVADIGLKRQHELFEAIRALTGQDIPVLDARRVLEDPRKGLEQLCARLAIPFTERMLSWPAGRRPSDGVWAAHWYQAVEESTGFQPYRETPVELDAAQAAVAEESRAYYTRLLAHCE